MSLMTNYYTDIICTNDTYKIKKKTPTKNGMPKR